MEGERAGPRNVPVPEVRLLSALSGGRGGYVPIPSELAGSYRVLPGANRSWVHPQRHLTDL